MKQILPELKDGAAPKFYCGGSVGCLIIHGFMASPGEVDWLGVSLAERGHSVYVVRLPGMGTNPADMQRARWQDWYLHVLDAYYILRRQCKQIFVVGHSMGGMLAMLLAASQSIDGLVVAATPLHVEDVRIRYARLLQYINPYTQHETDTPLQYEIIEEQKRRSEPEIGRVHYIAWHTRALYELYSLINMLPDYMPQITVPILLLYARDDTVAPVTTQEVISEQVSSQLIERRVLEKGGHILFQDADREKAFVIVAEFIARYG